MYGPHLILEGYGAPRGTLDNMEFIYNMLDEFPALIGMTKIMPPHVQRYLEPGVDSWGVSGFVIIAESHIAIHTYPEKGFFVLDIFSCKEFDVNRAVENIREKLLPARTEHELLNRGEDYPKDIEESTKLVEQDRSAFSDTVRMTA